MLLFVLAEDQAVIQIDEEIGYASKDMFQEALPRGRPWTQTKRQPIVNEGPSPGGQGGRFISMRWPDRYIEKGRTNVNDAEDAAPMNFTGEIPQQW